MANLHGIFHLELAGQQRELKCNFSVVERLERQVFKRPIMEVLNSSINGAINITEIVDTIYVGLEANKDTRLSRDEIGQEVMQKGAVNFVEWYLQFLTYAITGQVDLDAQPADDDKKK